MNESVEPQAAVPRRAFSVVAVVVVGQLALVGLLVLHAPNASAFTRRTHRHYANGMRRVRSPYPGGGTAPAMEAAIRQTWPESLHQAAFNVAWCESRGRATARRGSHLGQFQMGRSEWQRFGNGDPYDPTANAAAAYRYYAYVGSWRPWECQP